jgi:hypothetical protein
MSPRNDHLKYQVYRGEAYQQALGLLAEEQASLDPPDFDVSCVRIEPITPAAVEASYNWSEDGTLLSWEHVAKWKNKWPRGIDLAVWHGVELCGMAYANARDSKLTIKLILIEGKPDSSHPLKGYVLPIALVVIDAFARMLKLKWIEVQDPAPGVIAWYRENGFEFDDERRLVISVEGA